MLNLSEILSRKIAVTTYGNFWFPKAHSMLFAFIDNLKDDPLFLKHLKNNNTTREQWVERTEKILTNMEEGIAYTDREVSRNLKLGKVPYMFNATEVFEMEMENLKERVVAQGAGENTVYELLELCSELYNENNIFLTQPYADNFYMLDADEKLDEVIKLLINDKTREDSGVPKFKDISVIVRQFDLDEPIENDQHRWWVVKDNLANDPAFKNAPPRELLNHPDYQEDFDGDNGEYKKFVFDIPSMPYIADDVKPKYVQFIDIFGRRFCCDEPQCKANGAITWINNVQICLDNYGRPYSMISYHDTRQNGDEANIYYHQYNSYQTSMSVSSHNMFRQTESCFEGIEGTNAAIKDADYLEEWKRTKNNAEAEAVHLYLSTSIITHAVIGGLFRVTQWLNGDNGDVFVKEDTPIDRHERKRIKRSAMGQNTNDDGPTVTIKTLKVKPSLYVVEADGTERKLNPRELAQHTRRGHFAHYGINGKGLLFGKYVKSVYRKPVTIGKLENGLVIKDYELEANSVQK